MTCSSNRESWPVRFFLNRSGRMKLHAAAVCEAVYETLEAMAEKRMDCQIRMIWFDSDVQMVRNVPVSPREAMGLLDPDAYVCRGRADIPPVLQRVKEICREDKSREAGQKKSVNFFFDVFGDEWEPLRRDHSMDYCAENWFVHVGPEPVRNQQDGRYIPLCSDLTKYMTGSKVCRAMDTPTVKQPAYNNGSGAKYASAAPSAESLAEQIRRIIQKQS